MKESVELSYTTHRLGVTGLFKVKCLKMSRYAASLQRRVPVYMEIHISIIVCKKSQGKLYYVHKPA